MFGLCFSHFLFSLNLFFSFCTHVAGKGMRFYMAKWS